MPNNHLSTADLLSLLAGDGSASRRADAERHLSTCATCDAERQALRATLAKVAAAGNAPEVGDDARLARIRGAVDAARRTPPPVRYAVPTWGRFAVAAAAVCAVAGVVIAPPLSPRVPNRGGIGKASVAGRGAAMPAPGVAYAEVSEAMTQVSTVHWTETHHVDFPHRRLHFMTETWIRFGAHPARAFYGLPITLSNGKPNKSRFQQLSDQSGSYIIDPRLGCPRRFPIPAAGDAFRGSLSKEISEPTVGSNDRTRKSDPSTRDTPWRMTPEKDARGKEVLAFRRSFDFYSVGLASPRRQKVRGAAQSPPKKQIQYLHGELTILIDPKTHRMVHTEYVVKEGNRIDMSDIRDDFRYNETPPPGIFDWDVSHALPAWDMKDSANGKRSKRVKR